MSDNGNIQREVRVGLVLYGGISLSIYIYGVVLEFLRVIRARKDDNIYSRIVDNTGTRLIVDIISGTSAGGLNGVFLAKALCNGNSEESFRKLRELWTEYADFSVLINPDKKETLALLDETVFEHLFFEAFEEMDNSLDLTEEERESKRNAMVEELDLFVTTTNLNGQVLSGDQLVKSRFGQDIKTKEYGKNFHIKFRKNYGPHHFLKKNNNTLMKICRSTSAIPPALRPVKLTKKDDEAVKNFTVPMESEEIYVADGGVLDNKPFSHTINTIFRRPSLEGMDVKRILFYVEPDPETFTKSDEIGSEPDFWTVITKSIFEIRGYESIAKDIRNINERNKRIEFLKEIMGGAEQNIIKGKPKKDDKTFRDKLEHEPFFKMYRNMKTANLKLHLQERLYDSIDLQDNTEKVRDKVREVFGNVLDEFSGFPSDRDDDEESKNQLKEFLIAFDAKYRERRLYRLIEVTKSIEEICNEEKCPGLDKEKLKSFKKKGVTELWELFQKVGKREWEIWDINEGQLKIELNSIKVKPEVEDLSEEEKNILKDKMSSFLTEIKERKYFEKLTEEGGNLAESLDDKLKEIPGIPTDNPPVCFNEIFDKFEFRDVYFYPIEVLSGLGERDKIEVIRISPEDATEILGKGKGKSKIAGDAFFHYGGFLDKEWRDNDIMWGRLDAAELIVKALCSIQEEQDYEECVENHLREVLDDIIYDEFKDKCDFQTNYMESGKKLLEFVKNREKDSSELSDNIEAKLNDLKDEEVDYIQFLKDRPLKGEEDVSSLDIGKLANLSLAGFKTFKKMLKYNQERAGTQKTFKFVDKVVLKLLDLVYPIYLMLVQAIFGKDSTTKKIFRIGSVVLFWYGLITIILFVVGKITEVSWLEFEWEMIGASAASVIIAFVVYLGIVLFEKTRKTITTVVNLLNWLLYIVCGLGAGLLIAWILMLVKRVADAEIAWGDNSGLAVAGLTVFGVALIIALVKMGYRIWFDTNKITRIKKVIELYIMDTKIISWLKKEKDTEKKDEYEDTGENGNNTKDDKDDTEKRTVIFNKVDEM